MVGQKSASFAILVRISAVAMPAFHNYEFAGFPKELLDCLGAGKCFAEPFEKATSVIPTEFQSSQETHPTFRFKTIYAVNEPLTPVAAAPAGLRAAEGSYGSDAVYESNRADGTTMLAFAWTSKTNNRSDESWVEEEKT